MKLEISFTSETRNQNLKATAAQIIHALALLHSSSRKLVLKKELENMKAVAARRIDKKRDTKRRDWKVDQIFKKPFCSTRVIRRFWDI